MGHDALYDQPIRTYQFQFLADYHQIWLMDGWVAEQDRDPARGLLDDTQDPALNPLKIRTDPLISKEALRRRLGVVPGVLCIFTERDMDVPLTIEIHTTPPIEPQEDFAGWDHVVEASLELPSGIVEVAGTGGFDPEGLNPDEARIPVIPGTYRVRVYTGGLDTVSDDELDGEDQYRAVLWLAPSIEPTVLHSTPISRRW
ncbi:MAG: hypothetical protein ACXVCO_05795 [Ktedonobacterales bacterium]